VLAYIEGAYHGSLDCSALSGLDSSSSELSVKMLELIA